MEQLPQVGFMKSFVLFWKNYVNFKGRSRRSEYWYMACLLYTSPSPRDTERSRMPSSA
ncbi:hypothetical protein JMUB7552_27660 [Staphylococcus aureus]